MTQLPQIPTLVYIFFGFMVLANLGTIVTVLFAAARVIWWASKVDSRVGTLENALTEHHSRIDRVDSDLRQFILAPNSRRN